jgi:lysophospholipase L1-like esterase
MGNKKWNYIFGDSIAAGVGKSQQLKRSGEMGVLSTDEYGKSKVGAPPNEIVDYLKDVTWKLEGSVIVLSTGYSNGGGSDTSKNWIKQQFQYLKDKGSKVFVLGISNNPKKNPNLNGGNDWLDKTSKDYGFTFCGGFDPNETDYIHPKDYGLYWNSNVLSKLTDLPDANVALQQTPESKGDVSEPVGGTASVKGSTQFSYNVNVTDTREWEEKQYESPQDLVDDISGKIIFKVDSGPGPVLGTGEVEIDKGVATFKGLEFKDPGEYVITIKSTVNNIETKTIKIKVLEPILESKAKEDEPVKKEGKRAFIAQIDPPTIKVDDIKLELSNNDDDNVAVVSGIGMVPFVVYNFRLNGEDKQIPIKESEISYLKLYHNGIVPTIEFIFNDTNNIFKDNPPTDDKKIRFYLNPRDTSLKPISMQFRIKDFDNLSKSKYKIEATLDIPELYKIDYKSYLGTSLESLREICKKLEIGFNSNINNSDDLMSWRNVGDKYNQFISDIIRHSYVSEKSFMRGFIDYYYCLNFVDVDKEMNRDIKDDICIDAPLGVANSNDPVSLFLSNEESLNKSNSNRYFKEKKFENNSSTINLNDGIRTKTKFYDKVKKMFLVFDVDGTTTDGSKSLILKGDENDKKSFDNSVLTTYSGKIDTDNVHKNYNYSRTQNRKNLRELEKIKLEVELPNPNYSIYLYQKIDVKFINPVVSATNQDQVNWRKTGEYIVTEISYVWSNKKLVQLLTLSRKELGKNLEEMKASDAKPEKDTKTDNSPNPLPPGTKLDDTIKGENPNSIYTIGDKFIVRNNPSSQQDILASGVTQSEYLSSYRVFLVEVTGINPNGIDVTTKLKEIIPNSDEYKKYIGEKLPEIPKSEININEDNLTDFKKDISTFENPYDGLIISGTGTSASTINSVQNLTNQNDTLKGKKMLIIGDSQSAIKGDSGNITYTYPNILKPKLKEIGVELDVLAKGAMTTAWMIENLPGQLASNKYDIVMIYAGGNDASNSSYVISTNPPSNKKGTKVDTLSNFQKMVDMCVKQGADVFINLGWQCEDPNFKGEGKFGNYKIMALTKYLTKQEDWIPFIKRRIEIQSLLPTSIKNVKKFIPTYNLNSNTTDGIHPTAAGHKIVAEKIYDEIFKKYYNK